MKTVRIEQKGPVATIALSRPAERNAFNDVVIRELMEAFQGLDSSTRVVVLTGDGGVFSAGADLNWMKASRDCSDADNVRDAQTLGKLFSIIDTAPQAVLARVDGAALGGGLGLVACCDMAVATDAARFGFTEVRLGLVPAVISPFVLRKIGAAQARRYFLTGELFGAQAALAMNLVHQVVAPAGLDAAVQELTLAVLKAGPVAVAEAKKLIRDVAELPAAAVAEHCARLIARLRVSPEAQEGLGAFLEKRKPSWS